MICAKLLAFVPRLSLIGRAHRHRNTSPWPQKWHDMFFLHVQKHSVSTYIWSRPAAGNPPPDGIPPHICIYCICIYVYTHEKHMCIYIYIHIYLDTYVSPLHTYIHIYIYTFTFRLHMYPPCIHYIHYITLHYITLHYITLHYITLHYITLHYITLHYIHAYTYQPT